MTWWAAFLAGLSVPFGIIALVLAGLGAIGFVNGAMQRNDNPVDSRAWELGRNRVWLSLKGIAAALMFMTFAVAMPSGDYQHPVPHIIEQKTPTDFQKFYDSCMNHIAGPSITDQQQCSLLAYNQVKIQSAEIKYGLGKRQ